ncbi:MAG: hypothetical protein J3K34DRAFT_423463 [Monoraphidium minutum]|nr:MAG: hypothetical protein J3K34DRAFT_423463 [Monoraphidium minutum]
MCGEVPNSTGRIQIRACPVSVGALRPPPQPCPRGDQIAYARSAPHASSGPLAWNKNQTHQRRRPGAARVPGRGAGANAKDPTVGGPRPPPRPGGCSGAPIKPPSKRSLGQDTREAATPAGEASRRAGWCLDGPHEHVTTLKQSYTPRATMRPAVEAKTAGETANRPRALSRPPASCRSAPTRPQAQSQPSAPPIARVWRPDRTAGSQASLMRAVGVACKEINRSCR